MNTPLHQLELQEPAPDVVFARLRGEIDRSNAPEVRDRLLQAARGRRLLLDLTDLEFDRLVPVHHGRWENVGGDGPE